MIHFRGALKLTRSESILLFQYWKMAKAVTVLQHQKANIPCVRECQLHMFLKIPFWLWSKTKLYEGYFKGLFHIVGERTEL